MTATPTEPVAPKDVTIDWRELYAFGLPAGSVRSLLTIAIVTSSWGLIVLHPDKDLPGYLRDLLFLVLGHYFALRRGQSESVEPGPPPLFLPRGTVRLLIVLTFAATVGLLLRNKGLRKADETPAAYTLLLVLGFLLGVFSSKIAHLLRRRGHRPFRLFSDARAGIALLAAIILLVLSWNQIYGFLPAPRDIPLGRATTPLSRYGLEYVFSAVVGFYFGARS
jgi:hypothetical protein